MIQEGHSRAKKLGKKEVLASLLPPNVTRAEAMHTYFSVLETY